MIPVPVHFDGHNINIITEDSPSTHKSRNKYLNHGKKNNNQNNSKVESPIPTTSNDNDNNDNKENIEELNPKIKKNVEPSLPQLPPSNISNNNNTNQPDIIFAKNKQLIATGSDPNEFGSHDDIEFDNNCPNNNKNNNKDKQNLYKTELCREWSTSGWCYYNQRCSFAHGLQELRPVFRSKQWRTKRCRNWHTTGYCPYEHRCEFLHDQSSPRRISDYATANSRALVSAQQRMQPLYFHYQVDCNRDEITDHETPIIKTQKSNNNHKNQSYEMVSQQLGSIDPSLLLSLTPSPPTLPTVPSGLHEKEQIAQQIKYEKWNNNNDYQGINIKHDFNNQISSVVLDDMDSGNDMVGNNNITLMGLNDNNYTLKFTETPVIDNKYKHKIGVKHKYQTDSLALGNDMLMDNGINKAFNETLMGLDEMFDNDNNNGEQLPRKPLQVSQHVVSNNNNPLYEPPVHDTSYYTQPPQSIVPTSDLPFRGGNPHGSEKSSTSHTVTHSSAKSSIAHALDGVISAPKVVNVSDSNKGNKPLSIVSRMVRNSSNPHRVSKIIPNQLHEIISSWYPNQAGKLTGMFLQNHDQEKVAKYLNRQDKLKTKIDKFAKLLSTQSIKTSSNNQLFMSNCINNTNTQQKHSSMKMKNDIDKKQLFVEIMQIDHEKASVDSDVLIEQPLIQEIIRNENEYRKYIKTQPGGQTTGSNTKKPLDNNSDGNNGYNQNNKPPNDNSNNNQDANDKDDDDEKKEKQNKNENITDEYNIAQILDKLEKLKQHRKYKIMQQKNETLLDNELIALIYYTDSNSCCHKMKQAHRRLILANVDKWKMLYYHTTNAVVKMYHVFHYQNKNKFKKLFHGSTISSLDELSQEQLFLKTLFSFSTQFGVAKSFATGSILVVDNVDDGLFSGRLKGADVTWISKWNEAEFVILPTTYYGWKLMQKQEKIKNHWIVGSHINVYIASDFISNNDPLATHTDTTLPQMQPEYNKYKDIRDWFDNEVRLHVDDNKKYYNLFVDNGYDTLEVIGFMELDDLKDIGITKKGHVKKIRREIGKLRKMFDEEEKQKNCEVDADNTKDQIQYETNAFTIDYMSTRRRNMCDDDNCEFKHADTVPTNQFAMNGFSKADREHISKFHQHLHHRLLDRENEET